MVYEDYALDKRYCKLELSYMFPKKILQKLPQDTPPVYVSTRRQFEAYLVQSKAGTVRLCVEVKAKFCESMRKEIEEDYADLDRRRDMKISGEKDPRAIIQEKLEYKNDENTIGCGMGKNDEDVIHPSFLGQSQASIVPVRVEVNKKASEFVDSEKDEVMSEKKAEEEEEDDDSWKFDYCDDSDGTDSGDENFASFGILPKEENENVEDENVKDEKPDVFVSQGTGNVEYQISDIPVKDLALNQCFPTKSHLEMRLKILSVIQKFDFDVKRSNPVLLTVKCWVNGCTWKVRASPIGDFPKFHIRKYVAEHTCSVTDRSARCRQATHEVLGTLYKEFVGGVGPSVLPMHVADALNKRFQIRIEYWKAYRTLRHARSLINGTPESGYELLPAYLYMISQANPGTITRLEVDENQRFKYMFIAFSASINGFKCMRKVVVVDGTFLQGKYKGTLLTATAQDGNFQIYPIAFAVVDTENDDSWSWFFNQLISVIPDDEGLAIISDRHQSIANAILTVYPKSSRGICTYHLYKNILVRFKGREAFGLVKKAANACRLVDFQTIFDMIQVMNPPLHSYLVRADVKLWTRVHFPGDRYNLLTSNIAESMNNVLSKARGLPIVQLLETIRTMMTRWFSERRTDAMKMTTLLTRGAEKLLQSRVEYSKLLEVQEIDAYQVQVRSASSLHVVNLRHKTCSCRRFDLEKLPCAHAIAAAESKNLSRISLCSPYYQTLNLYNAYSSPIMPRDFGVPIPEKVATTVCSPPMVRQPPGRPKKARAKSALEVAMLKKKPRRKNACTRCQQEGHNARTCSNK